MRNRNWVRSGNVARASESWVSKDGSSPSTSATSSPRAFKNASRYRCVARRLTATTCALNPLGEHRVHIVPQHVAGLGLDQGRGFQHVAFGGVLGLDAVQFLGR